MHDISDTTIVPYQSDWPEKFKIEKENLKKVFGEAALEIEHIGSTSIPGLAGKPIIDIVVMIEDYRQADDFTPLLAKIGYIEQPASTERNYYTKGMPTDIHLSIAFTDRGGFWPRQIIFREYLRKHPDVRQEYERLKKELLQNDPTGRGSYLGGKTEYVHRVLDRAGWKEGQKYREEQ